jgi:small subunit ribosomal protein S6
MTTYELMMIVDPSLSDEERTAKIDTVKGILAEYEVKITNEDVWGPKKLAYKINKSETGYYVLYTLELD